MKLLRPITVIAGMVLLLVTTGDCVSLAFADVKAAECCLEADCPLAGGPQVDTCCKSPVSPSKYIQTAPQKSLSQPSITFVDFPGERFTAPVIVITRKFSGHATLHAPPDGLNALSTPLLI